MNRSCFFIPLIVLMMIGCSTISENLRFGQFEKTSKAYENTLREALYETASQFMSPGADKEGTDFSRYKNIKVFEYAVKDVGLSEDKLEIHQTVEIQYFMLDRYILKTIQDKQLWKYDEKYEDWFLQTGLPDFKFEK